MTALGHYTRYAFFVGCVLLASACGRLGYEPRADDAHTPSPPELAGLLARYFVDEADTGQPELVLRDSARQPLDLPMGYNGDPSWQAGLGGGRHLVYDGETADETLAGGGAIASITGTKLERLHGATEATLELEYAVVDCWLDDGTGSHGRFFGLGDGDEAATHGWLTARMLDGLDTLFIRYAESGHGRAHMDVSGNTCPVTTPSVVHWVVETTRPNQADRIRAYVDGARVDTVMAVRPPERGWTIDLGSGEHFAYVGRPVVGTRPMRARIYYAAIYDRALTDAEIAAQAIAIASSDDG